MKGVKIMQSTAKNKRLKAIFYDSDGKKIKTTNFGQKGGKTFVEHKDKDIKNKWLARHRVREDWNAPMTAGALSRWILWDKESISSSINKYIKRFGFKLIK